MLFEDDNPPSKQSGLPCALLEGRSLCFSPRWENEGYSIAFDRNSGDFWVLTDTTRRLLERLVENHFLETDECDDGETACLRELSEAGILRCLVPSSPR